MGSDLKKTRKSKSKRRRWLIALWCAAGIIIGLGVCGLLLLYKPAGFVPSDEVTEKQPSPYVSKVLAPGVYNSAQRQQPFDLIIHQEKTEDIISLTKWPQESDGVKISRPKAFFEPNEITVMATLNIKGVDVVVTITAQPTVNDQGLTNLHLAKVKLGAVNITPVARAIAAEICKSQLAETNAPKDNWQKKITASLLNDEPFDAVFNIDGKKVRIKNVTLEHQKLTIRFIPASK